MYCSTFSSHSKYSPLNAPFSKFLNAIFLRPRISFFATLVFYKEINMSKSRFMSHEPRLCCLSFCEAKHFVRLSFSKKSLCALCLLCDRCATCFCSYSQTTKSYTSVFLLRSKTLCFLAYCTKVFVHFVPSLCSLCYLLLLAAPSISDSNLSNSLYSPKIYTNLSELIFLPSK
jgi:hypothetical protein